MKSKIPLKRLKEVYEETGSVWKTADILGLSGQSVYERLVKHGLNKKINHLADEEKEKIRQFYNEGFKIVTGKLP